jgi:hypothetical protein
MSTITTQTNAAYEIVGKFIKVAGRLTNLGTISRVAQTKLNDPEQPYTLMAWSDNHAFSVIMHKSSDPEEIEEHFKQVSNLVLKQKKLKFVQIDKLLFAKDLIADVSPVVRKDNFWLVITPQVAGAKPTWISYDSEDELNENLAKVEQQLTA